jgi:hypothetical protein
MESMYGLLTLAASTIIAWFGYTQARRFVSTRLRYVDAINNPFVPVLAGVGAAVVAIPLVAVLPLVAGGTAAAFGLSVGMGVAAGRSEIRRALPPGD